MADDAPRKSAEDLAREARGKEGYDSFDDFKKDQGRAGDDKDWHHIVEKNQDFPGKQLHNTDNVIALDRTMHQKVSGCYISKKDFAGGKTVREWLKGQSFEGQTAFGVGVLRAAGMGGFK